VFLNPQGLLSSSSLETTLPLDFTDASNEGLASFWLLDAVS
jgi:hypothetical protein